MLAMQQQLCFLSAAASTPLFPLAHAWLCSPPHPIPTSTHPTPNPLPAAQVMPAQQAQRQHKIGVETVFHVQAMSVVEEAILRCGWVGGRGGG